jgi:hypothetical protein
MSLFPQATNGTVSAKKSAVEWLQDIESQLKRIPQDFGLVKSFIKAALQDGLVNDKELLLERIIQLTTSFPDGSPAQDEVTGRLLDNLWDGLHHPPLSYMGDEFKYRKPNGSNNNVMYPHLGESGSYYARSVVPKRSPTQPLPDPAAVFDAVMAREGPAKEHPAKFSSLAIALATIIIHDIFRTDDVDTNKVASTSYLDLGPLYGHNYEQQASVRTFNDGRLKPDAFTEARILGQPPGVAALLVSFNRFHNYVVGQLAAINENGRFTANPSGGEKALAKRDNDLFQIGRLVTCGLYVNIILKDYVRVILNLNRTNTQWTLDPRVDSFEIFDSQGTPKGIGNQVSIEFNLIYRWHATVSDRNAKWAASFFEEIFPGKDPTTLTQEQFLAGVKAWGHSIDADPGKWTFANLKRGASGSFEDAALVQLLTEETEDVAGAFGARNVPAILKAVEILGINQGREWGAASLNELREFFNLTPHKTFLDMNSDPEIASSLEALYGHPDNVEMYTGVVVEETKSPLSPGSGLCSGLTIAKAILSDAVALVRGDRFYAVDSSPANLTAFGYAEIASDPKVGGGTVIHKLLMRAYPNFYTGNSVYAYFPLTVPSENKKILQDLGKVGDYSYDRPTFIPQPTPVLSWKGVVDLLKDQENYKVPWGPHVYELTHHDWMLSGDKPWNAEQKKFCWHALYSPDDGLTQIRDYYEAVTTKLVQIYKLKLRNTTFQIDAVRDVANTSHAIVVADIFNIKLKEHGGDITPEQLYEAMATVFAYPFLDLDPTKTLALKQSAEQATALIAKAVTESVKEVKEERFSIFGHGQGGSVLRDYGTKLIQRLFEGGKSVDEVIWTVVPTSAAAAPIQSQGLARMLAFYLSSANKKHWVEIQKLAQSKSPAAWESLRKYALEAFRLASPSFGVLRIAAKSGTITDGPRTIDVKKGDTIFADFVSAGVDPEVFPDPLEVRLDRPDDVYIHHGYGGHACLGRPIVMLAMAAQLRVFARLRNLRIAPGIPGEIKTTTVNGVFIEYMSEDWSQWTPFPSTWKLLFDE